MIYIIAPLTWVLFFAVRSLLIILGWLLIPLAVMANAYEIRKSLFWPEKDIWAFEWPFMHVFGNEEDGICAGRQYRDLKSVPLQIIYWSALRNPVNNLRFIPILSCKIDPKRVRFTGSFGSSSDKYLPKDEVYKYDTDIPHWFFASCGMYSCFYWIVKMPFGGLRRLWIGFKIKPTDKYEVTEYRKHGAGFSSQFRPVHIKAKA